MLAILLSAISLSPPGVTLKHKVTLACAQLGIDDAHLTVPAALKACNEAMGMQQSGMPLLAQADELVLQLGLSLDAPRSVQQPPQLPRRRDPSLPRLVVFDLDFTLWKPELYQLSSGPPFKANSDGCVLTVRGERLDLFPAARSALAELADAGVPVAIASRASEREWALEIMRSNEPLSNEPLSNEPLSNEPLSNEPLSNEPFMTLGPTVTLRLTMTLILIITLRFTVTLSLTVTLRLTMTLSPTITLRFTITLCFNLTLSFTEP